MSKTNPNKVNQYTPPDPRQSKFLEYYIDPNSETFSNAYRSAIRAGYEEEYAKVILSKDLNWLSDTVNDTRLVRLAEKALLEALEYTTLDDKGKVDSGAGRLKMDAVKLVLRGLAKDRFSERTEMTGKDGKELNINLMQYGDNNSS